MDPAGYAGHSNAGGYGARFTLIIVAETQMILIHSMAGSLRLAVATVILSSHWDLLARRY